MADWGLQDGHSLFLTSRTTAEPPTDEATSWVMLASNGDIVRLPNERIRHKVGGRTRLDLSVPDSLRSQCPAFSHRSDAGTLYITTQRVRHICPVVSRETCRHPGIRT